MFFLLLHYVGATVALRRATVACVEYNKQKCVALLRNESAMLLNKEQLRR